MNSPVSQLRPTPDEINAIGNQLVEEVGTINAKIVLFAELDDGFVGGRIGYLRDGQDVVEQDTTGESDLWLTIFDAWDAAKRDMGKQVWTSMIYTLDHGKVEVRFQYLENRDPEDDWGPRADEELNRAFNGLPWKPATPFGTPLTPQ